MVRWKNSKQLLGLDKKEIIKVEQNGMWRENARFYYKK